MTKGMGTGTTDGEVGEVAGRQTTATVDHPWIEPARHLGVCMGDTA